MSRSALLLSLLLTAAAGAVDYDALPRKLAKEPAYQTKKPVYGLLLFGPEAKLAVWVVLDGETLYVDRNGNGDLTDNGEKFAKEADCKMVELTDPDGKTKYVIESIHSDNTSYTPAARKERAEKGIPPSLMVNVGIKGAVEYRQYCDLPELRGDPKAAQLAHFHGPLTAEVRTINWKVPDAMGLRRGAEPVTLPVTIGTMSSKHGCWVVRSCGKEEKSCAFPDGVRPVAEVEFPSADPKKPAVKQAFPLDGFC
jgi:hypothetical protein